MHVVPEETPGATVVAIKRVDELGFYCLSTSQVANQVGLTMPKTVAIARYLGLETDNDCFKRIKVGKSEFKRYSLNAVKRIKETLPDISIDDIWHDYRPKRIK
jgi:hypothetical protein